MNIMAIINVIQVTAILVAAFMIGWLYAVIGIINDEAFKILSTQRSYRKLMKRIWRMMKAQWSIVNYRLRQRFDIEEA